MHSRIIVAVVLLGAFVLVACGGSSTGDTANVSFQPASLDKPAVYFIHTTW